MAHKCVLLRKGISEFFSWVINKHSMKYHWGKDNDSSQVTLNTCTAIPLTKNATISVKLTLHSEILIPRRNTVLLIRTMLRMMRASAVLMQWVLSGLIKIMRNWSLVNDAHGTLVIEMISHKNYVVSTWISLQ